MEKGRVGGMERVKEAGREGQHTELQGRPGGATVTCCLALLMEYASAGCTHDPRQAGPACCLPPGLLPTLLAS
jgi:hypothetical protein